MALKIARVIEQVSRGTMVPAIAIATEPDVNPKTVAEWQRFLALNPRPLVTLKVDFGQSACSHTSGHTLISVSSKGIAKIHPKGSHVEIERPISDVKLWIKGLVERRAISFSRQFRELNKAAAAAVAEEAGSRYIVDTISNRLLVTVRGQAISWTTNYTKATEFQTMKQAQNAASHQRGRLGRTINLLYLTLSEARRAFPATNVDPVMPVPNPSQTEPEVLVAAPAAVEEVQRAAEAAAVAEAAPVVPAPAEDSPKAPALQPVAVESPAVSPLVSARATWAAALREVAQARSLLADCEARAFAAEAELRIAECQCGRA